jgi:hypothetical protein
MSLGSGQPGELRRAVVRRIGRVARVAGVVVGGALLAFSLTLIVVEPSWSQPAPATGEQSFLHGSTGTENMPLVVWQVLPDMFPDQFQPGGPAAGDWITQFGFTPGQPGVAEGLPVGFAISHHRPRSGSPSPVPFVGFTCGLCHTALVQRTESDPGVMVPGMGSPSLDFIAWVDALKSAVLDERRMTVEAIDAAARHRLGRGLGGVERLFVGAWLRDLRATFQKNLPKFDDPYSGRDLREAAYMPNGPSRTQPFRNLVRNVMDRPATLGDHGYCKIPSLFEQSHRHWGQFDGSVGDRLTRSVLAAIAVGATLDNLIVPDISTDVVGAIDYTTTLKAPRFATLFPDAGAAIDSQQVARGRVAYDQHCRDCHGARDGATGAWLPGRRQGEVIPVELLGTDPERVRFRYFDTLADLLYAYFPAGHPLKPRREDLRPGPAGRTAGFINAPIEGVWARAPYLHNGSVSTLAELINLKPRRTVFYRGRNLYDVVDVGLVVPEQATARNYYRFDTRVQGNSNAGHDYPWAYRGPGWNEETLRDLLEYLKTTN